LLNYPVKKLINAAEFIKNCMRSNPDPPPDRSEIVATLRDGVLVSIKPDTVYGLGCYITNQKAIDRICKIRDQPQKA